MNDEELENDNQEQRKNRFDGRSIGNPANNIADKAQNIQKTANQLSKTISKNKRMKKEAEILSKVAKNAGKVSKVAVKLGPVIGYVAIILLIIIVLVGILTFILTGFGYIMAGLQKIIGGISDAFYGTLMGDEDVVHEDVLVETLNYIKELGYDLYGYGFISDEKAISGEGEEQIYHKSLNNDLPYEEAMDVVLNGRISLFYGMDDKFSDDLKEKLKKNIQDNLTDIKDNYYGDTEGKSWTIENVVYDQNTINVKEIFWWGKPDDNGSVEYTIEVYKVGAEGSTDRVQVAEDFNSGDYAFRHINAYIISDNYANLIKNSNKNFKTAFSSFSNFFSGLLGDSAAWGSGLLSIYHQNPKQGGEITGIKGDAYSGWEQGSITINNGNLAIKTRWFI